MIDVFGREYRWSKADRVRMLTRPKVVAMLVWLAVGAGMAVTLRCDPSATV